MHEAAYAARPWQQFYRARQPEADVGRPDLLRRFLDTVGNYGSSVAIDYFDRQLTFDQLDDLSGRLATALGALGIRPTERILLAQQNTPDFFISVLACWKLGGVPTPCNPLYREREFGRIIRDCEPSAAIAEPAAARELASAAASDDLPLITIVTDPPAEYASEANSIKLPLGALRFEDLLRFDDSRQGGNGPELEDLGLLLYTSGTTGEPKGAMLTHASLAFNAEANRQWFGYLPTSRLLTIAPLFHITGFMYGLAAAIDSGCSTILTYRFEPDRVLRAIRRHRPTSTIGPITAYNSLLRNGGWERSDFASFDAFLSGGAPIPTALRDEIETSFGTLLIPGYGMTEAAGPTHFGPLGIRAPVERASGALSIGVPMPGVEVLVVGEDGNAQPVGEAGEILLRGPQIMKGYWRKPLATEEALRDGWLHSGDIGLMDAEGWFYLVDRKKDMIIASGFKVWPREVEDVLYGHPAVREAAVIAAPDAYRGETVKAVISTKPGLMVSEADLLEHCRARLTGYKVPRLIEIVDELPKTVSGKIQRNVLRDGAAEARPGADNA